MHILVEANDGIQRVVNTALVRQIRPGDIPDQTVLEFGLDDFIVVNLPLERFATKLHAFPIEV